MQVLRRWVLAAMVGLVGCSAPRRTATVSVSRDVSVDAFARVEQRALQESETLEVARLAPTPLDAAVIERLIRQRMGQVTASAITDLFRNQTLDEKVALALRDLLSMLQGLLAQAGDQETRSQALITALLRNGLTVGVSELTHRQVLPDLGCPTVEVLNATYEGLAASAFLKPLGFTQAVRMVPQDCQRYTAQVAWFMDTLASVGLSLQQLVGLQEAVPPVLLQCRASMWQMPAELRLAIQRIEAALPDASDFKHYQQLSTLIRAYRMDLQNLGPPADACILALEGFSSQFDSVLEQLGGRSPETGVSVKELEESVRRLRLRILNALSDEHLRQVFGLDVELPLMRAFAAVNSKSWDWKELLTASEQLNTCRKTHVGGASVDERLIALATMVGNCKGAAPAADCVPCQAEVNAFLAAYARTVSPVLIAMKFETPGIPPEDFEAAELLLLVKQIEEAALPLEGLPAIRSIVVPLVRNEPLRRDDIIQVNLWLQQRAREKWPTGAIHQVLEAAFDSVNQSIREDGKALAGIRMDVTALTTSVVARFVDVRRPGPYLRATVGAGYLLRLNDDTENAKALVPSLYEELGVGYRWSVTPNVLVGPHLITSGLLYQAVSSEETKDTFLLAGGVSANVYRLLDVSLNAGYQWSLGSGSRPDVWVITASLQLPLSDYLTALVTDDAEVTVTSPSVVR